MKLMNVCCCSCCCCCGWCYCFISKNISISTYELCLNIFTIHMNWLFTVKNSKMRFRFNIWSSYLLRYSHWFISEHAWEAVSSGYSFIYNIWEPSFDYILVLLEIFLQISTGLNLVVGQIIVNSYVPKSCFSSIFPTMVLSLIIFPVHYF